MLSNKETNRYLSELEVNILAKKSRFKMELSKEWRDKIPSKAGVYAIFENDKLEYIGETGNIRERMRDMADSRHHQLRRNIGALNFSKLPNYKKATSREKFPPEIEVMLNDWIIKKLKIMVLPLELGRKEIEEHLFDKYKPKYNIKGRRQGV